MPLWILSITMKYAFNTKWAETVISNHALNAQNEMKVISNEFVELARSKGYDLKEFKKLVEKEERTIFRCLGIDNGCQQTE